MVQFRELTFIKWALISCIVMETFTCNGHPIRTSITLSSTGMIVSGIESALRLRDQAILRRVADGSMSAILWSAEIICLVDRGNNKELIAVVTYL